MTMAVRHHQRDVFTRMVELLTGEACASMSHLARALYGHDTPKSRRAVTTALGRLRQAGYRIECPHRGHYVLKASPAASEIAPKARTPEHALRNAIRCAGTKPTCDCGQPATHVAQFWQLDPACRERFLNALAVCETCAGAFDEAEDILPWDEATARVAAGHGITDESQNRILAAFAEQHSMTVGQCAAQTGLSDEYVRLYLRESGRFVARRHGSDRKCAVVWALIKEEESHD